MKEVVLLIGPPGVGKTTYCKTRLPHHERVSQDDLGGDRNRCRERYKDLVVNGWGRFIVVDRCNFNRKQREFYVKLARENGYSVRMVVFTSPGVDILANRAFLREGHPTLGGHKQTEAEIKHIIEFFIDSYRAPAPDEYDELEVIECE